MYNTTCENWPIIASVNFKLARVSTSYSVDCLQDWHNRQPSWILGYWQRIQKNARKNYLHFAARMSNACISKHLVLVLLAIIMMEQVYNFSFVLPYDHLENIAVLVSTIESNFFTVDDGSNQLILLRETQLTFDSLFFIPILSPTSEENGQVCSFIIVAMWNDTE